MSEKYRAIGLVIGALAASCSPASPWEGDGPETPVVAEATGRTTVLAIDGPGSPLIVDWKPEQRADLEVAMREGVAVVHYDGKNLQLLRDCHMEGKYDFVGVTTKTQVVRLEDEQEVQANLPLGGLGLVAQLGAKLGHGTTLDVAMVIVGKSRTTWISPTQADLKGPCDGATHFVRGATVGACINLSVQYMGGDGVAVDGKKALELNLRACDGNEATACGNVGLHYELGMIVKKDVAKAVRLFERACRIDKTSCSRLAIVHQAGYGVPKNEAKAKQLYTTVCAEEREGYTGALACTMLNVLFKGQQPVDKAKLLQIVPVMKPQCEQEVARACGFLGAAYLGLGDDVVARAYLDRARKLGDYWACDNLKRLQ